MAYNGSVSALALNSRSVYNHEINAIESIGQLHRMSVSSIEQGFLSLFGRVPEATYFAPGRVNLIGEHIDYNGGRVMPAAITSGTRFAVARNGTESLNIHSAAFPGPASIRLADVGAAIAGGTWTDYVVGMLRQLVPPGAPLPGVDVLVHADLPQNAGLSSSASFTVGFGFALADLLGLDIDPVALALKARAAENDFVGVNCGIMDQFAIAVARADHCLVLDCDSLAYERLPLELDAHDLVIVNSMVPRKLAESAYNRRRAECEQALAILQREYPVRHLCELDVEQVAACAELSRQDALLRRARHAASENQRVAESVAALKAGKLTAFGALMNASHDSLRDDYEVSCQELDLLVDLARSIPGVLGSRMTGAGFGGCTVSIVASAAVAELEAQLKREYATETGLNPEVLVVRPGDGVKRIWG